MIRSSLRVPCTKLLPCTLSVQVGQGLVTHSVFAPTLAMNQRSRDRWFMARVGAKTECVTSPWPTCTLRVHGNNLVHGTRNDDLIIASRLNATRVLKLAQHKWHDLVGFWR